MRYIQYDIKLSSANLSEHIGVLGEGKMLQGIIVKKIIDVVLKRIMEKSAIRKMRKYVEEDNELDVQVKQMQKSIIKQGRTIEELEKDNAILKKYSHPSQEYICCKKCGCKIAKSKIKKRR